MSEYEHHKGKLVEVKSIDGENLSDIIDKILKDRHIEVEDYYDSKRECFEDQLCGIYIIIENKVYEITSEEIDPYDDIMNAKFNEDGTINFEVKYYNGGCGFSEAIECAIERASGKEE